MIASSSLKLRSRLFFSLSGLLRSLLFFRHRFLVVKGGERIDSGLFGCFRHFLFHFLLGRSGFAFRERFVECLRFTFETLCKLLSLMRLMIGKTRTGRNQAADDHVFLQATQIVAFPGRTLQK